MQQLTPPSANPAERRRSKRWMSEAVVIAASPIAVYILTLTFQIGYAATFDVPAQLMAFTRADAWLAVAVIALTAVVLFEIFCAIYNFPRWPRDFIRGTRIVLIPILLAEPIVLLVLRWNRSLVVLFIVAFFSGSVLNFIILYRQRRHVSESDQHRRFLFVQSLIACVFAVLGASYCGGAVAARAQREFYVLQGPPETVVLGMTTDELITAPFDPQTKTVEREYIITKISGRAPIDLRLEKIGPLHLENAR